MVTAEAPEPTVTTCCTPVVLTSKPKVPLKLKPFPSNGSAPLSVSVSSPARPAFDPPLRISTPSAVMVSNAVPPTLAVKLASAATTNPVVPTERKKLPPSVKPSEAVPKINVPLASTSK